MGTSASTHFAYATLLILLGSLFSMAIPFQHALASHSEIEEVMVDDIEPGPGDSITVSGFIDGADEGDTVDITVHEPDGGSDSFETEVDDDEEFSEEYDIPDSADDGIYEVEVEF